MNERQRALSRDLEARARLAADPIYQIKQKRRQGPLTDPRIERGPSLTPTSHELLLLGYASRGLTDRMIGDAMGISRESVKTGLRSVRARLRAKNTTHACCEALRRGLIT